MLSRSIGARLLFVFVIVMAAQITACGGDDKRADKAVKWLKDYSTTNPPNGEWITTSVEVDQKGRIVMDVLIPDEKQIKVLKSRSRIEQSLIVHLACPPNNAEIWTLIDQDRVLWVNLTARTKNGLAETLIGASCKHQFK